MKTLHTVLAVLLMGAASALAADKHAKTEGKPLKPQTKCPIMGGAISRELYADVQGQRIYVCCKGCIAAIEKDPAKAFAALQKNGERAESRQKTCPVMGGTINPKLYVEYEGRRIYACCEGCLRPMRKDPAKYAEKIAPKPEQE